MSTTQNNQQPPHLLEHGVSKRAFLSVIESQVQIIIAHNEDEAIKILLEYSASSECLIKGMSYPVIL